MHAWSLCTLWEPRLLFHRHIPRSGNLPVHASLFFFWVAVVGLCVCGCGCVCACPRRGTVNAGFLKKPQTLLPTSNFFSSRTRVGNNFFFDLAVCFHLVIEFSKGVKPPSNEPIVYSK